MTSTDIVQRRPATPQRRSKQARLSAKLQVALTAIIEQGHELDQAARTAGLTTHALRCALNKPHVIAELRARREVFHAYVRSQNIHYAADMRANSTNETARLGAMRLIEGVDEQQQRNPSASASPGVTIKIIHQVVQPAQVDATFSSRKPHASIINGLAGADVNAPLLVSHEPSHDGQAVPQSAVRLTGGQS